VGKSALPEDPNLDRKLAEAFGPLSGMAGASPVPADRNQAFDDGYALGVKQAHESIVATLETGGTVELDGVRIGKAAEYPGGKMIYTLLWRVMAEVGHVAKAELFKGGGVSYNFRGIDAVVNALGPALRNHGVIPVPKVKTTKYRDTMTTGENPKPTREVTVKVKYTFYAPDGSKVKAVVPGESLDHSDKGSAKAMSVAFRIALLQIFALPTTEPDPDSSYHTRGGPGAMSPSVAKLLRDRIGAGEPGLEELADAAELERLWPIVLEHSAAERTIQAEDTLTWAEAFIQRFRVLIEEIETWEGGKAMLGTVERLGLQRALGVQLKERAEFLRQRVTNTYNHVMEQILAATDREALDVARGCGAAAVEVGILTEQHQTELDAVARDRWAKLAEPEPSAAEEPEPDLIPAEGEAWDRFVAAAELESPPYAHLWELLTNERETLPYAGPDFGLPGLQRVADAVARAHRRDHSITNVQRAELEGAMVERAERFRIEWSSGYEG
jgi:hypothetical protein